MTAETCTGVGRTDKQWERNPDEKNVPVEQMLKYLGYENLTREMLEEYVQGIYVYDDGRVEVEWKPLTWFVAIM